MELEASTGFEPVPDGRVKMDEPLPVSVVAVEDVTLTAPAGVETKMDALYVGLLGFERAEEPGLVYWADNVRVRFDVVERPVERDGYRALQLVIPSLADAEKALAEAKVEYERQRGLVPGSERLVLLDPAGNWVELSDRRELR